MSFKITKEVVNSRRARVIIQTSTGAEVVTLYSHPVMLYSKKQLNYQDTNVPVIIEMLYGSTLCSKEIIDKTEMHDTFYDAIKILLKDIDYNLVMVRIPNEEMYNLYAQFVDKLQKEFVDLVFYKDTESKNVISNWSSECYKALGIAEQFPMKTLIAIKKDHLKVYEKNWWNTTQEIIK